MKKIIVRLATTTIAASSFFAMAAPAHAICCALLLPAIQRVEPLPTESLSLNFHHVDDETEVKVGTGTLILSGSQPTSAVNVQLGSRLLNVSGTQTASAGGRPIEQISLNF